MADYRQQYEMLKRSIRNTHLKLVICDKYLNPIKDVEYVLLGGNTTVNANSDLRRTFSVELLVLEKDLKPFQDDSLIWFHSYVQFLVGIEDLNNNKEIVWYNQGFGLIDAPSWTYDATNNTLSFDAIDLVAELNGERGGYIQGIPTVIASGENIKNAITQTLLTFTNITEDRLAIEECYNKTREYIQPVPYDLEFEQGSTVWDILVKLRDILPNYEMYFDEDGVFHYKQVPYEAVSKSESEVVMFDDLWKEIVLSENTSLNFRDVYNYIEVYGQTQDLTGHEGYNGGYGGVATYVTTQLERFVDMGVEKWVFVHYLSVPSWPEVSDDQWKQINDGTIPTFLVNAEPIMTTVEGFYIRVNQGDIMPVVTPYEGEEYMEFAYEPLEYVNQSYLIVNGSAGLTNNGAMQHYGEAKDTNPDSPFNIDPVDGIGIIRKVCFGGEYENIYSDDLCTQRAQWELYQACRVQDTITLISVPNYLLQVNTIVKYTSYETNETHYYLVQSFNTDWNVEGTTNVTLQRYYPYYEN